MKIASVEGYWSTNIGNAFFQISANGILNDLGFEVFSVPDVPGFINVKKGNPNNYFEFMNELDTDYFCIHGPFFRKEFDKIYLNNIKKIRSRGIKVMGLGVGSMHYDSKSISYYNKWLKECEFDLISTRDLLTYNFLKGTVRKLHNGIDLGFFISYYKPQPSFINDKKFICYNFDQIPEPIFFEDAKGPIKIGDKLFNYKKSLSGEPRGIFKKLFPYIRPYFKRFHNKQINQYDIIRLDHRFNPYSRKKIYTDANTFSMDTPPGFLIAYANSLLTLSNRVHANVATLSYGNKAMYFSDSKRAKLLDRLGLNEIYNRPMSISKDILDNELNSLKTFLKNSI